MRFIKILINIQTTYHIMLHKMLFNLEKKRKQIRKKKIIQKKRKQFRKKQIRKKENNKFFQACLEVYNSHQH